MRAHGQNCIAWLIPTKVAQSHVGTDPATLWSLGRLHVLKSRTMGGMWRITVDPPSAPGGTTMLVTEYQSPLITVSLSLLDRQPASDLEGPAPQCSGPVRAALRWDSPPISEAVNVFAGLFADDAAFKDMPTVLT